MAVRSDCLLVKIASADVAMFRFLLEAHENLAYCTTLDAHTCLLKVIFAPGSREAVLDFLYHAQNTIKLTVLEMPVACLAGTFGKQGSDIIEF